MSEIITTYKLDDLEQPVPMDRDEFYDEQIRVFKETGKPTRVTANVQVLIFTPSKDIILQKRSYDKRHNSGLIDKTMGGHIKFGDSPSYTVMLETLQELNVPSIITLDADEFNKTYKLLKDHLNVTAVIQFIESCVINAEKIFNDEKILIGNKYNFYLGVYNGALKPADREAAGLLFVPYDKIQHEINRASESYTSDIKFFLSKYAKEIDDFLKCFG